MTTPTLPFDEVVESLLNMTTGFVWIFGFTVIALIALKLILGGFAETSDGLSEEDLITDEQDSCENKSKHPDTIHEKSDAKPGVRKVIM